MPGLRFKVFGLVLITQTRNDPGTARMEATSLRRVDKTRRLARRHLLEGMSVAGIGV